MFKSARSRLRAAVFACAAALGLGAYAATPVAVWDGDFNVTEKNGVTFYTNGNTVAEDGSTVTISSDATVAPYVILPKTYRYTSIAFTVSNLSEGTDKLVVLFGAGSTPNATGVYLSGAEGLTTSGVNWGGKWNTTTYDGTLTTGAGDRTFVATYDSGENGTHLYEAGVGSSDPIFGGGGNNNLRYANTMCDTIAIGGGKSVLTGLTPLTGLVIKKIAVYTSTSAIPVAQSEIAAYAIPAATTITLPATMSVFNEKVANATGVINITGTETAVELDVEPSDAAKAILQNADVWRGTVLIKDKDKNAIVPTDYGNPHSTLKISGVKGYFAKAQYAATATPAIELEDSTTEGREYGLWQYDGFSYNAKGDWAYVATPELKGSGTLKCDKDVRPLLLVGKWSAFTGTLNLSAGGAVWFGLDVPAQESALVTSAMVKFNGALPSGIAEWTYAKASGMVTQTAIANSDQVAFFTNSKWTGTCKIQFGHNGNAFDIVNYGNAGSVIEIAQAFSAYPTKNGGKAAPNLAAELKLSANWTVANGWDSQTTTFAKLSGTGNLIVNGASGGSSAIPYTITKIENFTGALGGARGQFAIGTIVSSVEPVGGTKLVSLSNCTKTPVLTNTTVEYNGAAVEGITLEVKSDGIYVAVPATVDVTVPVVDNTVVTVTVGGETVAPASEGGNIYKVVPGSVVTVTYAAVEGYEISGTTEYTVNTANATTFEIAADMVTAQYVAQIKTGPTTIEKYTTLDAALDSENIAYGITLLADVTENDITFASIANISGNNHTINANITIANGGQLQLMLATLNGTLTIQGGGTYVTLGGTLGNVVVQDGGIINLTTLSEDAAPLTVSNLTVNGALTIVSSFGDAKRGKTYKAISYATGNATIAEGASFNGSGEWSASRVEDGDNTVVCLEITKVAVVDGVYYDTAQEAVEAAVASGKQALFLVHPGTVTLGAGETLVVKGGYQPTVELDAGLSTPPYEVESDYDTQTGIYTYAVKSYVAQIGNTKYESLADAVAAATSGQTVKLLADVTLDATVVVTNSLTLDLNGHDIVATDARALWIKAGAVSIMGEGEISANATENSSFEDTSSVIRVGDGAVNANAASLTIGADVTVSSGHCYGITTFGKNTPGISLVVNGTVAVTGTASAISGNGSSGLASANITVNDGAVVSATADAGIYFPGTGTLSIAGGTITGPTAVYVKCGTVNVTGGTLTGTAEKAAYAYNGNGLNATGDALVIDTCGYPGNPATVSVTGGTFTSQNAEAVAAYKKGDDAKYADDTVNEAATGFVSGGTFNTAVADTYCAEGFEPVDNGGTYGVRVDKGWIYEAADAPGYTGSWNKGISYDETTHKAEIEDGATYTASKPSAGQLVTINLELSFDAANSDDDVHEGAKAAIRLGEGETEGTYVFQLYTTNELGTAAWLDATASGVTPTVDQDYAFKFVLDMTNKTFTATVDGVALTVDGAETLGFASANASDTVQSIEFAGAGKVTSITGSYEDIEGFVADETIGGVTLTAAQAEWLNGQGNYDALAAKIEKMDATAFNNAYLLNLNLDVAGEFSYDFKVSDINVAGEDVTLTVSLTRTGALANKINGTVALTGTDELGKTFATISEAVVTDDDFSDNGSTTTITLKTGGAKFFQPVIKERP